MTNTLSIYRAMTAIIVTFAACTHSFVQQILLNAHYVLLGQVLGAVMNQTALPPLTPARVLHI